MTPANSGEFTAVGLTVTQALVLWTAFGPKFDEVRTADLSDTEFTNSLRHSEIMVGGITAGIGLLGSMMLRSKLPFFAAIASVAVLVLAYEASLRYDGFNNVTTPNKG